MCGSQLIALRSREVPVGMSGIDAVVEQLPAKDPQAGASDAIHFMRKEPRGVVGTDLVALKSRSECVIRIISKFKITDVVGSRNSQVPLLAKRTNRSGPTRRIVGVHHVTPSIR
jgi:hypothetical protein